MRVLLLSTYELGHQPLHVASPAAALLAAGHEVRALDLAVQPWSHEAVDWAEAVAVSVPMHTAMRLALRALRRLRRARPGLAVCLYGLYAPVGRDVTVGALADRVIAGEYEPALLAWVHDLAGGAGRAGGAGEAVVQLGRGRFQVPARHLLPPLDQYARLRVGGEERLVGYVEASHGCAFRCRHCPVPTVYDGRTRLVGLDTVLADVEQLVAMGARHLTFGDPDFLGGPHHALRVVHAVHGRFPQLTFDVTTKVELVLRHRALWPELAAAGCLFVVSAFEHVDDAILEVLDKGHTAADAAEAVGVLRAAGIEVRPSLLPFTPWTSLDAMVALVDFVAAYDLVASIDPVQWAIRLLVPDGSLLADHPALAPHLRGYDAEQLGWRWAAADPRVDALHADVAAVVEEGLAEGLPPGAVFLRVAQAVREVACPGVAATVDDLADAIPAGATEGRPRLTEPWFC